MTKKVPTSVQFLAVAGGLTALTAAGFKVMAEDQYKPNSEISLRLSQAADNISSAFDDDGKSAPEADVTVEDYINGALNAFDRVLD